MFSTCLFCHSSLGTNQRIEHFPIGRRLAFDTARGRLWAVCPKCARWNLTPIEERWEAIDECEREYRDTTRRVSSDNIALAKLKDGTDLVRIGQPLRPEFTAWRYGEHLRRRRRNFLLGYAGSMLMVPAMIVALPSVLASPLAGVAGLLPLAGLQGRQLWRTIRDRSRRAGVLRLPDGALVPMFARHAARTQIGATRDGDWDVVVYYRDRAQNFGPLTDVTRPLRLQGAEARRVARDLIPHVNGLGGSRLDIHEAVKTIEEVGHESVLLKRIAENAEKGSSVAPILGSSLALEMLLHEEDERQAMAGELGELYTRWEEAERIAKIADGELTPIAE